MEPNKPESKKMWNDWKLFEYNRHSILFCDCEIKKKHISAK